MADMFGTKWTNSHGVKPDERNVWAAALSGLDSHDIEKGLRVLSQSGAKYPPSTPEFRKMCVEQTPNEILAENKAKIAAERLLPRKRVDRQANKKAAAALKQAFGRPDFTERMETEFQHIFGNKNEQ